MPSFFTIFFTFTDNFNEYLRVKCMRSMSNKEDTYLSYGTSFKRTYIIITYVSYAQCKSGIMCYDYSLEECVVQLLIINIDLAQFRPSSFPHLSFECLCLFLILKRCPHLHDARLFDELGQVEWRFFYTALSLEIL